MNKALSLLTLAFPMIAAAAPTGGKYCIESGACRQIQSEDVRIFVDRRTAYVSIGSGADLCIARPSFAKENALSLVELKTLILGKTAQVNCRQDGTRQVVMTGFAE